MMRADGANNPATRAISQMPLAFQKTLIINKSLTKNNCILLWLCNKTKEKYVDRQKKL
jgi:hypothetical protein